MKLSNFAKSSRKISKEIPREILPRKISRGVSSPRKFRSGVSMTRKIREIRKYAHAREKWRNLPENAPETPRNHLANGAGRALRTGTGPGSGPDRGKRAQDGSRPRPTRNSGPRGPWDRGPIRRTTADTKTGPGPVAVPPETWTRTPTAAQGGRKAYQPTPTPAQAKRPTVAQVATVAAPIYYCNDI